MSEGCEVKSFDNVFIVPVWGAEYTRVFLEICLPMLISPGNFGHMSPTSSCVVIVTDYSSYKKISQSRAISELNNYCSVDYVLGEGVIDFSLTHRAMTLAYYQAMRQPYVVPNRTNLFFLTPDSFWSDGAFRYILEQAEAGKKVVCTIGLRVEKEAFEDELRRSGLPGSGVRQRAVPNRDLLALAFRNLHDLALGHIWNSAFFVSNWPSNIYWSYCSQDVWPLHENSSGEIKNAICRLVSHSFHLHPIFIKAPQKLPATLDTIDGDFIDKIGYAPNEIHVVQSSDDFLGIELSPRHRKWNQQCSWPVMRSVLKFAITEVSPIHWYFFDHKINYIAADAEDAHLDAMVLRSKQSLDAVRKISIFIARSRLMRLLRVGKRVTRVLKNKIL